MLQIGGYTNLNHAYIFMCEVIPQALIFVCEFYHQTKSDDLTCELNFIRLFQGNHSVPFPHSFSQSLNGAKDLNSYLWIYLILIYSCYV